MFELTPDEQGMLRACLVEVLYGLPPMPDAPRDLAVVGKELFERAPRGGASLGSRDVLIALYTVKTTLAELVPEAELSARTGMTQLELWRLLDRLNAQARAYANDQSIRKDRIFAQLAGHLRIALLGRVRPNLRGVSCAHAGDKVDVLFVFDGDISQTDRELFSLVETELLSHYEAGVDVRSARLDAPGQILSLNIGEWVFLRWEPDEKA